MPKAIKGGSSRSAAESSRGFSRRKTVDLRAKLKVGLLKVISLLNHSKCVKSFIFKPVSDFRTLLSLLHSCLQNVLLFSNEWKITRLHANMLHVEFNLLLIIENYILNTGQCGNQIGAKVSSWFSLFPSVSVYLLSGEWKRPVESIFFCPFSRGSAIFLCPLTISRFLRILAKIV